MATLEEQFNDAQTRVNQLPNAPDAATMLDLYGLFKQASNGDVQGKRPGMLDVRGRAKYDAWAARKGMTNDEARQAYIDLVGRLVGQ